ncbi:SDR family NAD(P)-dependent oxidoreductase [Klenkia sp. PcliD-1-E]|uniref:SDR family NAD(P)-dependent oxidoreductase n=1 Tax=Klenkia sp. PcliD-1-E TaxID=2954492 RepID=UPI0020982932|nr:SDR family NAD(P)-dependent oxidoreductase [Klenkia sp. PcliD-1-E]MCO7219978.1 SDR family NAD(P)-dependent oxidoreductase [Klenkia sp. PcliD-1-E]
MPSPRTPSPVVLLGGRSEIGLAVVHALLADGPREVVLARRPRPGADDQPALLRAAGATVVREVDFDADDVASHRQALESALDGLDRPVVVLAFGVLGDQARAEHDPAHAAAVAHTDYVAQVAVLTRLRAALEDRGGTVLVFSSIAGVRVRRANYVYGSAKAGLDGFVAGLQDSLHGSLLRVVLVRPGFVVGRMTAGMSPAPLSSTPSEVATAAVAGLRSGRGIVWVPGSLRWVALAFRVMPRPLWRRLPR